MQAECIYPAFDNQTSVHYAPGLVVDFDVDNEKLNSLTVPGSPKYVFKYPGHETVAGGVKPASIAVPVSAEPEPAAKLKKGKPMSEAVKAKIRATRAAKLAARQARLNSEAA